MGLRERKILADYVDQKYRDPLQPLLASRKRSVLRAVLSFSNLEGWRKHDVAK